MEVEVISSKYSSRLIIKLVMTMIFGLCSFEYLDTGFRCFVRAPLCLINEKKIRLLLLLYFMRIFYANFLLDVVLLWVTPSNSTTMSCFGFGV